MRRIDQIIDAVLERGYDDAEEASDDFALLITTYRSRKLVTFELCGDFPPKRHEYKNWPS